MVSARRDKLLQLCPNALAQITPVTSNLPEFVLPCIDSNSSESNTAWKSLAATLFQYTIYPILINCIHYHYYQIYHYNCWLLESDNWLPESDN